MYKIGIGVIVYNSDTSKILAGVRINTTGENLLALPGGHLEDNETIKECCIREMKEECGVDISNSHISMEYFGEDNLSNGNYITLYCACIIDNKIADKIVNSEPDKCKEWQWYNIEDLVDKKMFCNSQIITLKFYDALSYYSLRKIIEKNNLEMVLRPKNNEKNT